MCYEEQLIMMSNKMKKINNLLKQAKDITCEADETRNQLKVLFNLGEKNE
jgi:hypothetical protein